jgi:hypothetical protein
VTTITGIRLQRGPLRICCNVSRPVIPGRFRSSSTNPGQGFWSSFATVCRKERASWPLPATWRSAFGLYRSRMSFITNMSVGLSSTNRTVSGSCSPKLAERSSSPLSGSEGEVEGGPFAGDRSLQPDPAAVLLHDALANGQTNPASGILTRFV